MGRSYVLLATLRQELPIPGELRHGIIESGPICLFWLFCLAYSCYFILLAGSA